MLYSQIIGCGLFLPKKVLTNQNLSQIVDTSDEWIYSRTGIKQRHVALKDELTSDLAIKAAQDAIQSAKIKSSEIDCIIVATTTPDNTFPSTATKVQNHLKKLKTFLHLIFKQYVQVLFMDWKLQILLLSLKNIQRFC